MWIRWYFFLRTGLKWRFSNVRQFKCCPVVIMSPDFRLEKLEKQRSTGTFVSSTKLNSIKSLNIMRDCMRTTSKANAGLWHPFLLNITPKSSATLLPYLEPQSIVKYARSGFSFARWVSTFWVIRDILTAIESSVWLCLSWLSVFMVSTLSIYEWLRPGSRQQNSDYFDRFVSENINFPFVTLYYIDVYDFPKVQIPIALPDSVAPANNL